MEPLDGDTRAVWVVGTSTMGRPLAGFHPVTVGEQHVQIQGAQPGRTAAPSSAPLTSSTEVGETRSAPGAPGARSREPRGPIGLCASTHALMTSTNVAIQAGWYARAMAHPALCSTRS